MLTGEGARSATDVAPTAYADENALATMPTFVSKDGVLQATLIAAPKTVHVGPIAFEGEVYNGEYAGPVLRARPGDTMRIRLVNRLNEPTNLHFHGMQSSPLGNGDNMHIVVNPGETFDYEIKIPKTQPPGLYWYHSHLHGIAEKQVMGGLSGALIVEGLEEQFHRWNELKNVRERLFVLKDYSFDDDDIDDPNVQNLHNIVQSINGRLLSTISLRPGETQLWRFTNQSANRIFHLALADHTFRVIARDGSSVTEESRTDHLDINPASRVEVLVDGGRPGVYDLTSTQVATGPVDNMKLERTLGQVVIEGEKALPEPVLAAFPELRYLRNKPVNESRTFVFTQDKFGEHFFINGRSFDHTRIDTRVPLGNIEDWTIRNDSDGLHIFHIHQVGFDVMSINGEPQPFRGYVDTVRVPERGEVRIRMAFTDPLIVGDFMYHCHVLEHEDKGMMANIEVYNPTLEKTSSANHIH